MTSPFLVHARVGFIRTDVPLTTFPARTIEEAAGFLLLASAADPEVSYMPRITRGDGSPLSEAENDTVDQMLGTPGDAYENVAGLLRTQASRIRDLETTARTVLLLDGAEDMGDQDRAWDALSLTVGPLQ